MRPFFMRGFCRRPGVSEAAGRPLYHSAGRLLLNLQSCFCKLRIVLCKPPVAFDPQFSKIFNHFFLYID
jgi:hypothetical protein